MNKKKSCLSCGLIIIVLVVLFILSPIAVASESEWQSDTRLTVDDDNDSWVGEVEVIGNNIYVIWDDNNGGIFFQRSMNQGVTWSSYIILADDVQSESSYGPSIAVNGNFIHVVWAARKNGLGYIYYIRSIDNGRTWSTPTKLVPFNSDSRMPNIAVNGTNVHVVWEDGRDGNSEIYYKRSTDNGENWDNDTRLTFNELYSGVAKIAVHRNNIHIVWYDGRDGNSEIYYKRSTDNGENWDNDTRLTTDNANSDASTVVVNGTNVHVVWEDSRDGNWEIYYKRSTDNGENWHNDIRLTNYSKSSVAPAIALSLNNIHVVWHDYRDGNSEIYYKRSTDNGENWHNDTRLTYDDSYSGRPQIAVNGNNLHIIWDDNRDGNDEIYYKQKLNQKPTINTFNFSSNYAYKGEPITIYANADDDNDKESDLIPTFEFKLTSDNDWQSILKDTDITWDSSGWFGEAVFIPSDDMEIGVYDLRVKFTDSDGIDSDWRNCEDQIDIRVHPIAVLTVSKTKLSELENIAFNALQSIGKDLVYSYDFGDGTTSDWDSDAVKNHTYAETGTYIAKVKVKDAYGEESPWESIKIIVSSEKTDEGAGTIGFELILAFCAIILVLLLKRRKET